MELLKFCLKLLLLILFAVEYSSAKIITYACSVLSLLGFFSGNLMLWVSISFVLETLSYSGSMERHFLGQASMQEEHVMQRKWSMLQVFLGRETSIASHGQAFEHFPHNMHLPSSIAILPFRPS